MMKRPFALHPFLVALFPILFLYSHNIEQLPFSETVLPLVMSLGSAVLLVSVVVLLIRSGQKAGIIVSIFLILFFSYGHIYEIVQSWEWERWNRHKDLMRAWAVIFGLATYFTIRTRKKLNNLTSIFNFIAVCLIVISLVNIAIYKLGKTDTWRVNRASIDDTQGNVKDSGNLGTYHDIYYIILDGYAHADTLKELCGYDNSEFIDYLAGKGFYVASKSRCNYPCTYLSLASSMNLEYINYLQDQVGRVSKDVSIPIQMIKDSKVVRYLKERGYKYIHFSSNWAPTKDNENADLVVGFDGNFAAVIGDGEFADILIETTVLSAFSFARKSIAKTRREQMLATFSALAQVQRIGKPKFVFAHIFLPHPPYIFGRNGEEVTETESSVRNWEPKSQYLDQLIFVNKKTEELVDGILSASEIPPIIILQSDHGPAFSGNKFSTELIQERMRILNAYYLPDMNKALLYPSISPVNTFRLVFKYYFYEDYELVEDAVYFTDTDKTYFDFVDITDQVKDEYK